MNYTFKKGFTLIELLVVIGILAVLFAIVLVAINPSRQFSQANNTKRSSNVNAILNAISQFSSDNKGSLPASITSSVQTISKSGADLCLFLVTRYLAALPVDPVNGTADITDCSTAYNTGYTVIKTSDNRVTVAAPQAELGASISATR